MDDKFCRKTMGVSQSTIPSELDYETITQMQPKEECARQAFPIVRGRPSLRRLVERELLRMMGKGKCNRRVARIISRKICR